MGKKMASFSRPVTAMCKETVNAAHELSLEVRAYGHTMNE